MSTTIFGRLPVIQKSNYTKFIFVYLYCIVIAAEARIDGSSRTQARIHIADCHDDNDDVRNEVKPQNRGRTAGPAQQFNYIVEEEEKVHYVEVKLDSSFVKVEIREVDDNGDEIVEYCEPVEDNDNEVVYDTYEVVEEEEDDDEEEEEYEEEYEDSEEEEEYILSIQNNRFNKEADLGIILEDDEDAENESEEIETHPSKQIEEEEEDDGEVDEIDEDDDFNMETLHSEDTYMDSITKVDEVEEEFEEVEEEEEEEEEVEEDEEEEDEQEEDEEEEAKEEVITTSKTIKLIENCNEIEEEAEVDENTEEEADEEPEEDDAEVEKYIPATLTTLIKPCRNNHLIKPTLIFENDDKSKVDFALTKSLNVRTRKQYSFDDDCDRPSSATPRLFNLYNIEPNEYKYRSKLPLSNDNSDVDIYYDFSEGPSSKLNSSENISEPLARHDMFLDSASSFNSRSSSMDQFSSSFDQMPLSSRPSFEDTDSDLSFNYRDTVNEADRRNGYLPKQPSMTNIGLRADMKTETKISVRDKISAFNQYSISKTPKDDVEKREPMKKILFNNTDTARSKILPLSKNSHENAKLNISSKIKDENLYRTPTKFGKIIEGNEIHAKKTTSPTVDLNSLSDNTTHLPTLGTDQVDDTVENIPEDIEPPEEQQESVEEEVKSPRSRRFAKYQRAKTHSRLFKLLQ